MSRYVVKHPKLYQIIEDLMKGKGVQDAAEIRALIVSDGEYDGNQVAQAMRRMVDDGKIHRSGDSIIWAANASENGKVRPYASYTDDSLTRYNGQATGETVSVSNATATEDRSPRKIELAPFLRQRQGHLVTVERAPDEYEGIIQIQFKVGGTWFNMPFQGSVRICIGGGIPKWVPEQEMNTGVSAFRLVRQDGSYHEQRVNPNEPIVIAPGG
jgi:hypothetical protein